MRLGSPSVGRRGGVLPRGDHRLACTDAKSSRHLLLSEHENGSHTEFASNISPDTTFKDCQLNPGLIRAYQISG